MSIARTPALKNVTNASLPRNTGAMLSGEDLQQPSLVGAIADIDPVALRPARDRTVQFGRHRTFRAGLLAHQAEIADEFGMRGIAQVIDLHHAPRPPARCA